MSLRICKVIEKQPPTPAPGCPGSAPPLPSPPLASPCPPYPAQEPLEEAQAQATPLGMLRLETDTSELKHKAAGTGTEDLRPTVSTPPSLTPTPQYTINDPLKISHHHQLPNIPMTPATAPGPAINPQCTAPRTPSESSPRTPL